VSVTILSFPPLFLMSMIRSYHGYSLDFLTPEYFLLHIPVLLLLVLSMAVFPFLT